MKRTLLTMLLVVGFAFSAARPAAATFHLMQVEQVIGGVDGNTGVQAIQLRMRSVGQNLVGQSRLNVRDAAGLNPILLLDITANVANSAAGARVLLATSNFSSFTNPALTPDFVLANTIPASYLAAGSLTFEDDFGTIYWRLSWGSYSGSGAGSVLNDDDGNFSPAWPLGIPLRSGKALQFTGAASATSTTNAAQYALTSGPATFIKNNGAAAAIKSTVDVGNEIPGSSMALGQPTPNPAHSAVSYSITLPRSGHALVRAFDVRGRMVRTLLDRDLTAGRQNFTWDISSDAPSLSSGVYLLVLEAGGEQRVRRVTYLRGAALQEPHGD